MRQKGLCRRQVSIANVYPMSFTEFLVMRDTGRCKGESQYKCSCTPHIILNTKHTLIVSGLSCFLLVPHNLPSSHLINCHLLHLNSTPFFIILYYIPLCSKEQDYYF